MICQMIVWSDKWFVKPEAEKLFIPCRGINKIFQLKDWQEFVTEETHDNGFSKL